MLTWQREGEGVPGPVRVRHGGCAQLALLDRVQPPVLQCSGGQGVGVDSGRRFVDGLVSGPRSFEALLGTGDCRYEI